MFDTAESQRIFLHGQQVEPVLARLRSHRFRGLQLCVRTSFWDLSIFAVVIADVADNGAAAASPPSLELQRQRMANPRVFFEIGIQGESKGRIVFELRKVRHSSHRQHNHATHPSLLTPTPDHLKRM